MRVFISFAKEDANLATQLEAALRRNNIETWVKSRRCFRRGLETSSRS